MEEREASSTAWALAPSISTSSRLGRLSSDSSLRLPMRCAMRQYRELSGTIFTSSGKWYPYHSLQRGHEDEQDMRERERGRERRRERETEGAPLVDGLLMPGWMDV
ncbi:hypothetical protein EYF80_026950 [Liparis tanakae]|uniref:Uncharacterized protein n=1 Tax=Liparis tanakae TaxID=230148 RepID=A0A4Z2HC73_9TELE|nr:hypothetical protein EYF80_026950 [Liparis tanakae]